MIWPLSRWYSGTLINNDLESELDRIADQLALFKAVGASVIVYGETYETVQNRQERALSSRPKLDDLRRLWPAPDSACRALRRSGVPLTFHHHMGTAVETEAELDAVMNATGEAVGLFSIPVTLSLPAATMPPSSLGMASGSTIFTPRTSGLTFLPGSTAMPRASTAC